MLICNQGDASACSGHPGTNAGQVCLAHHSVHSALLPLPPGLTRGGQARAHTATVSRVGPGQPGGATGVTEIVSEREAVGPALE